MFAPPVKKLHNKSNYRKLPAKKWGDIIVCHVFGHFSWRGGMSFNYVNMIVVISALIARVTLNRPERRNALSLALMRELTACLREIGGLAEIRAIILSAAGSVFSSGHDLTEMRGLSIGDYRRIFDACVEMMNAIQSVPQPVIAEVQGMATAAGCQLVAACDLAVAAEEAK